jgi:hypothetical protein
VSAASRAVGVIFHALKWRARGELGMALAYKRQVGSRQTPFAEPAHRPGSFPGLPSRVIAHRPAGL